MKFLDIFLSIMLEATPFLLLGVVVSSLIQYYVSDDWIENHLPKKIISGTLTGIFLGLFIPLCDCAIVPIVRRLIKKRIPLNICISFLLSSPILNPVSILSTIAAFHKTMPVMIFYRIIFAVIISFITGIMINFLIPNNGVLKQHNTEKYWDCHHCEINKKDGILKGMASEFWAIFRYLCLGAILTSITQSLVDFEHINLQYPKILQIIIMMFFAFIISLCSTEDAFIAKTFLGKMTDSSILAFLLLGPMLDMKNMIVLKGSFTTKFIITLFACVCFLVICCSLIL